MWLVEQYNRQKLVWRGYIKIYVNRLNFISFYWHMILCNLFIQVFVYCIAPPITFYFLFLYYFIYCNRLFYSHLAFLASDDK